MSSTVEYPASVIQQSSVMHCLSVEILTDKGQVLDSRTQSPWRLSFLSDLFWGVVEFIGLFFQTLVQPDLSKDGNSGASSRFSDGRGRRGVLNYGYTLPCPLKLSKAVGLTSDAKLVIPFTLRLLLLDRFNREKKIEGLTLVQSLAQNHAHILLPKLHDMCLAVVKELQRAMDPEVEMVTRNLLHKACKSSLFIEEAVDLALSAMVQSCSSSQSSGV
ncbi:hypothetical protein P4O66_003030 [Electrophorus voltai]|uniref:Selenoprotein K n=1 Tax=Electrophorus voltai TaxID=2609070 RepID=A0AAD8YSS6_9TELE|nr:hypothetical protein P4O66_003030 [Electrophorus voltai]